MKASEPKLREDTLAIINVHGRDRWPFHKLATAIGDFYLNSGMIVEPDRYWPDVFMLDSWFAWDSVIAMLGITIVPENEIQGLVDLMHETLGPETGMGPSHYMQLKIPKVVKSFIPPQPKKKPFHEVALNLLRGDEPTNKALRVNDTRGGPFAAMAYFIIRCSIPVKFEDEMTDALCQGALMTDDYRIIGAYAEALSTFSTGSSRLDQICWKVANGNYPNKTLDRTTVFRLAALAKRHGLRVLHNPNEVCDKLGLKAA